MKIIFFNSHEYEVTYFNNHLLEFKQVSITYCKEKLNSSTAVMTKGFEGVICFVNDELGADCLKILADCGVKAIFLRCAGFNNVDIATANKLNLKVYRVPAYSPEAVAEHAIALLMTLNRKIHKAYLRSKEMNFSLEGLVGMNINGKTIGVVGLGRIGKSFCRIMSGYGVNILGFDPFADENWAKANGITLTSKENLLSNSDIISFHCPLNENTHHFLNLQNIFSIKKDSILVNTSRGALIETRALIQALKQKHVGGAALDVYEFESELFFTDHSAEIIQDDDISRLMSFPNVLITSHQGFLTKEALQQIALITLQNIMHFVEKTTQLTSPNLINP
jgi:D-lactate dehydrogenase